MYKLSLQKTPHHIETFVKQSFNFFHTSYKSRLTTYRAKEELWNLIKVGILFGLALFFGGLFLYYVNLASTRGYFMKIESRKLDENKAKSDIIKLEVIKQNKENRDSLVTPSKTDIQKRLIILSIPKKQDK